MDWGSLSGPLLRAVLGRVVALVISGIRWLFAGAGEKLLRPRHAGDLRLVFSSVPREPVTPSSAQPHPEFNYLAGPNEVDFAWTLYPILRRLVPTDKRLHAITFSRQMYIGGPDTIPTANVELWKTNLLVSGSTKFNEVTRQLHSDYSQLPVDIVFVPEGGTIVDKRTEQPYSAERRGGEITADYGIFAKYWNPFDLSKTIAFVAGAESVYQLGVTRTLTNRKEAKAFRKALTLKLGRRLPRYYEALVRAPGRGLEFTGPLEVIQVYPLARPQAPGAAGNRPAPLSLAAGLMSPVAAALGWLITYSPLTLRASPTIQMALDLALATVSVLAAVTALVVGTIALVRAGHYPKGKARLGFATAGVMLGALEVLTLILIAIVFAVVATHP